MKKDHEIWRPLRINDQTTRYQASNQGQIRRSNGLIVRLRINRYGYYMVSIYDPVIQACRQHLVAGLIASAFIGPRIPGMQVDHIDNDKQNNRATNLRYLNQSANIKRSFIGRVAKNKNRYLSAETHERVKAHWWSGQYSQMSIGILFGLSNSTISKIVNGKIRPRDCGFVQLHPDPSRLDLLGRKGKAC